MNREDTKVVPFRTAASPYNAEIETRLHKQFVKQYIDTHSNIGYNVHGGEANAGAEHQQRFNPWAYRYHNS